MSPGVGTQWQALDFVTMNASDLDGHVEQYDSDRLKRYALPSYSTVKIYLPE